MNLELPQFGHISIKRMALHLEQNEWNLRDEFVDLF